MSIRPLLAAIATLVLVAPTYAQDGAALIQKYNCGMCHAPTPNGMAPTFASIAGKYKGNAGAQATLVGVIQNGGHGGGPVSMPATAVSDADAKAMASYILATK
jgi:cytochrome c